MKKPSVHLGLHVSDSELTLVALRAADASLRVLAHGRIPLPAGLVVAGRWQDAGALAHLVSGFLRENRIFTQRVTVTMTPRSTRLKVSELHAVSVDELHEKVGRAIEHYHPFGKKDTYGTYRLLRTPTSEEEGYRVLQVLTSRQTSDACLDLAQDLHWSGIQLEPTVLPLMQALPHTASESGPSAYLLLTFDAYGGCLVLVTEGDPAFCKNVPMSLAEILQDDAAAQRFSELLRSVVNYGQTLGGGEMPLKVVTDTPAQDLAAIVERLHVLAHPLPIERIDTQQLAERWRIVLSADQVDVPSLALSAALASVAGDQEREPLNLIMQESVDAIRARRQLSLVAKAVVAVVLVSLVALVPVRWRTKHIMASHAAVESSIAEALPHQESIRQLQDKTTALQKQSQGYVTAYRNLDAVAWHTVLQELVRVAPSGLRFLEIDTQRSGRLGISGEALGEPVVHALVQAMQQSEVFNSAEVIEVVYDQRRVGVIEFQIKARARSQAEEAPTP